MFAVYLSHYELKLADNRNTCFRDYGVDLYRTDPPSKRARCLRHRYSDSDRMPPSDTQARPGDFALWQPMRNVCAAVEWGHHFYEQGRDVGGRGTLLVTPEQFALIRSVE